MNTNTTQTQVAKAPSKEIRPVDTVRHALESMQGEFAKVLPKHITPERLCRVAMTAVQQTPKLLECDKKSLYAAVMRAAQLGLEPDGILGQAYLIPYGKQVQFIPGYKGLIDLARRSGDVINIIAKEVYKNDTFRVNWANEIPFEHVPLMEGDRGEVTHFWALARFKDGGFHWDYLTRKEVENIRDRSSGKNNAVWKDFFVEMGKKTAIRRIAKYLPMSVQRASMVEDLVEAKKKFTIDSYGDIIVDNNGTIEGEAEVVEAKTAKLDNFAKEEVNSETGEVTEKADDEFPGDKAIAEQKAKKPAFHRGDNEETNQ